MTMEKNLPRTQKGQHLGSFLIGEEMEELGVCVVMLLTWPHALLCAPLHLAVPEL